MLVRVNFFHFFLSNEHHRCVRLRISKSTTSIAFRTPQRGSRRRPTVVVVFGDAAFQVDGREHMALGPSFS